MRQEDDVKFIQAIHNYTTSLDMSEIVAIQTAMYKFP